MKKNILRFLLLPCISLVMSGVYAKPPNIKPGLSYYSEEYHFSDGQYEIAEEKNLEEVFKNYSYYETVYDQHERIKLFRAYKRGAVDFTETYFYDEAGKKIRKVVSNVNGEEKTVEFAP